MGATTSERVQAQREEQKVDVLVDAMWLTDRGDLAEAQALDKLEQAHAAMGVLIAWLRRYDVKHENPRHDRLVDGVLAIRPAPKTETAA